MWSTISFLGLFIGPPGRPEVLDVPTVLSTCGVDNILDDPTIISTCSHQPPETPKNVSNTVYMIGKQDLGISLCGGYYSSDCWVLTKNGTWIGPPTVKPMAELRSHGASVQLGNEWWFTGQD